MVIKSTENKNYLESILTEAKKVLLNHNSPTPITVTLIKSFYYFAGKEWWKDYLSKKHDDVIFIFLDTETGEKYKLDADGKIYLYNIFKE